MRVEHACRLQTHEKSAVDMLDVFVRIHVNHCFGSNWYSKSRC